MNRIISLFLFIFVTSCLNAQYNSPIKNKLTLGKQTTADGLIFRGNAADTATATLKIPKINKQDTSAYLLLDTINNVLLKYNISTTYWTRLNILPTDTASMLTPYFRDADTTSLNLNSRFATKLNISDTASMLTNYLRSGTAASTYLSGSGTTNYIPKFTGSKILGNSLINDNGNFIGINKTTPTVGIDLVNDISAQSAKLRLQTNFQSAIRTLELGSGDGLSWDLPGETSQSPFIKVIGGEQSVGGGGLNLMTDNTSRIFIRKDGNIGVGLTNPSFKLDINGTLGVTGATTLSNQVNLGYSGSNLFTGSGIITDPGNLTGIKLYDGALGNMTIFNKSVSPSFGSILFSTGNTSGLPIERMRITHEGNINITNNVTANSFIKSSGTSTQFLKADGSVDGTSYLPLTGGTLTGALSGTTGTFNTRLGVGSYAASPTLFTSGSGDQEIHFTHSDNVPGRKVSLRLTNNNGGFYTYGGLIYAIEDRGIDEYARMSLGINTTEIMHLTRFSRVGIMNNSPSYTLDVNGTFNATGNSLIGGTLGVSSNITANSFIKSSGTSTQFLKADGSVDNNTYLTTGTAASTYQTILTNPVTGTGTNEFISKFTSTGSTIGNSVIQESSGNIGIGITPTSSLELAKGKFITLNSRDNTGQDSSGIMFYETSTKSATDINFGAKIMYDAISDNLEIKMKNYNGTSLFNPPVSISIPRTTGIVNIGTSLAVTGNISANSFIKSSGTSSEFLKADGSVDNNTYLTTGTASSTYLPLTGGTLTGTLNGTNQNLNSNLSITDPIPGNAPRIYTSVTTGPSTTAAIRLALDQSSTGGANMFMGGSQLGGGNSTNPNIFFADTRRAYASVQGIYTGAGITSSGHIVFNTTPNDGTTALTERMRIAQDGAITMGGTLNTGGLITSSFTNTSNYSTSATDNNAFTIYNNTTSTNNIYGGLQFLIGENSGAIPGGPGLAQIYGIRAGGGSNPSTDLSFSTKSSTTGVLEKMRIKFDGKVGIGTSTPSYLLDVNGTFNATGNSLIGGTLGVTGSSTFSSLAGTGSRAVVADVNGVLSAPVSSINYKENVQSLNYGLKEILKINPVSFEYIDKNKWGEEKNLGFIVEDIFPIIPEVTGTMQNNDLYLDMVKLIPILTKAIQEQNALIKTLEQRIIILENK